MGFGDVGAGQPVDFEAVREGLAAFAADRLALARGQRGEEGVEIGIAVILPVKLTVGALQETALAEMMPFVFGDEGPVRRGGARLATEFDRAGDQPVAVRRHRGAGPDQEPAPRRRRERHADLELGIIAPAGALIGIGPAIIEDIFAHRMGLQIGRHDGPHRAFIAVAQHEMARIPASTVADGAGGFQRIQKIM